MPARPDAANILKVEFLWSQNGVPAANVQYVKWSGTAPTAGACAAIAADLGNAFWNIAKANYSTQTIFQACRVTDLTTSTGASGSAAIETDGTAGGEGLPAQACCLVNHTIARRYRGGHPRTYYPALSSAVQATPQAWTSGAVTSMGSAQAAFALEASTFSESGCAGVYVVNVSYVTSGAPRVTPVIDQITGSTVSGIFRTQRRRVTATSY